MRYIGIDLAWAYAKESGICIIDDNGMIVYCESMEFTDEMIASLVEEYAQGTCSYQVYPGQDQCRIGV